MSLDNGSLAADWDFKRAVALYKDGRNDQAKNLALKILQAHPDYGPAHHLVAVISYLQDDRQGALDHAQRAVEEMPQTVEYLKTLVQIQARMNFYPEALGNVERALALDSRSVSLLNLQAETQLMAGNPRGAIKALQQIAAIEPDNLAALLKTGEAFQALGLVTQALASYRQAMNIDPGNPRPHQGSGLALLGMGEYAQAKASFLKAHELDPDLVDPLIQLARVEKAQPGDEIIAKLETILQQPELRAQGKAMIRFAVGKMYDDCRDYDRAFAHFAEANRQREILGSGKSSLDEMSAIVQTLERCCDENYFAERNSHGHETELPVFVVGMPRSGTTLIETLLASHHQVHGAGELIHIADIQSGLMRKVPPESWDPLVLGLKPEATARAAKAYADHLQSMAPQALRIVDKMPRNFQNLWLIALLFPRARVIHSRRDPVDTCLSCFVTDFVRSHNYRNDLTTLGRYYRLYQRLMDHWKRVCPLPLLEVHYEELVANQEKISRRMVEFLGLQWDEDCLDFHKSSRSIQTASNVQVGRAMYTTSIERWRRYEKHLGPLLEALDIRR